MAVSKKFLGVTHKLLLHWGFKVLLFGIRIFPRYWIIGDMFPGYWIVVGMFPGWLRYRILSEVSNNSDISNNWEIWDWMDLNSCLLKTFCPQLRVISSSSSFFRLGLAELVDKTCIKFVAQFMRPPFSYDLGWQSWFVTRYMRPQFWGQKNDAERASSFLSYKLG